MAKNKKGKVISIKPAQLSPENYIKANARSLPIEECLITDDWESAGICNIIIARSHKTGNITFGIYLVDLYCLGVKDADYYFNMPVDEYEQLKHEFPGLEKCEYPLAHNIIYGALVYAEDFGFKPHKDFSTARFILDEDDENTELIEIEFGMNGTPCYVAGPYDDEAKIQQITKTLLRTAGEGNFDIVYEYDDDDEFDEYEDVEGYEPDEEAINELAKVFAEEMIDAFNGYIKVFKKINNAYNKSLRTPEDVKLLNQSKIGKKYAIADIATEYDHFKNEEAEAEYERLYEMAMVDHNYHEVVKGALKAIKKYPENPKFRKMLQFAYTFSDEPDKADAAIMEEYRLYPGYLLAKISYANMLISLNKLSELPAVFDNKADLNEIYPDRDVFSYEEAAAFYGCMCRYFTKIDDIDSADKYMNAIIKHKLLNDYGPTILRPAIDELCKAKMDKLTEATS